MLLTEDGVLWCDLGGLSVGNFEEYPGTAVKAESVRWRIIPKYLGPEPVYGTE